MALTTDVETLLRMDRQNRLTKDATGAVLFGVDAAKWPAWWFDSVTICGLQEAMHQNRETEVEYGH